MNKSFFFQVCERQRLLWRYRKCNGRGNGGDFHHGLVVSICPGECCLEASLFRNELLEDPTLWKSTVVMMAWPILNQLNSRLQRKTSNALLVSCLNVVTETAYDSRGGKVCLAHSSRVRPSCCVGWAWWQPMRAVTWYAWSWSRRGEGLCSTHILLFIHSGMPAHRWCAPVFRASLPTSVNPVSKLPHSPAQSCVSKVIPDSLKWTTNVNYRKYLLKVFIVNSLGSRHANICVGMLLWKSGCGDRKAHPL